MTAEDGVSDVDMIAGTTTAGAVAVVDKGAVEDFFCTLRGTVVGMPATGGSEAWTEGGVGVGSESPRDGRCGRFGSELDETGFESDEIESMDVPLGLKSCERAGESDRAGPD